MLNNKILSIALVILAVYTITVHAYRIPRPNTFLLPWTNEQMKQHNEAHEDLWNLQNGEFNFDIVTTSKTNASNGDIWILQTGAVARVQFKAVDRVFTLVPEGI